MRLDQYCGAGEMRTPPPGGLLSGLPVRLRLGPPRHGPAPRGLTASATKPCQSFIERKQFPHSTMRSAGHHRGRHPRWIDRRASRQYRAPWTRRRRKLASAFNTSITEEPWAKPFDESNSWAVQPVGSLRRRTISRHGHGAVPRRRGSRRLIPRRSRTSAHEVRRLARP